MAVYNFETITAAEAASFNPATDNLLFSNVSASAIAVALGSSTTTLVGAGRTVVLGTTATTVADYIFADGSQLFVGTNAANGPQDLDAANSAAFGFGDADTYTVNATGAYVSGGLGDDILAVSADGTASVFGGMGDDAITLSGDVGSYANGNMGDDTFTLNGSGSNTVNGGQDSDTFNVDALSTGSHVLFGDFGTDEFNIASDAGSTSAFGGDGIDTFNVTGDSSNLLSGNTGDDIFVIDGNGNNTVFGGQDSDTFTINGDGNNTLSGDLGDDTFTIAATASGNNTVLGGDGIDRINIAGTGNNVVNGNVGADIITVASTATGENVVFGGRGDDSVNASASTTAITLNGDNGNDTLIGGSGADTITGGAGSDSLTGGTGADLFKFAAGDAPVSASGDIITDFSTTVDTISFGGVAGNGVNYVEQSFGSAVTFDAATAQANNLFDGSVTYALFQGVTVNGASTTVLFADLNGDGTADASVVLTGVTAANFSAANIVA